MASSSVALRPRTADGPWFAILGTVVAAWSVIVLAELTGAAHAFHHHALIENGPPLPIAAGLFLVSWLVMVVAMMLPASLVVVRAIADTGAMLGRPWQVPGAFLVGFLAIWAGSGLLAFLGDMVLHRVVDASPWLGARPWLLEAGVLALAGACQFAPPTRRSLRACRRGTDASGADCLEGGGAIRAGIDHGRVCLGATWALMLLMFAESFDSLVPMVALSALMTWQARAHDDGRATTLAGIVLLLAAVSVLSGGGVGA